MERRKISQISDSENNHKKLNNMLEAKKHITKIKGKAEIQINVKTKF